MPYQFARQRIDLSDYASGKVFYSLPHHPAFPIRLASEILQRCLALRQAQGLTAPCSLYDPCCGAAYHLSALAYFHWPDIGQIMASDIDAQAVRQANRNLSLLTLGGLEQRIGEIEALLAQYGKESHQAALNSALALRARLTACLATRAIPTHVFQADATDAAALQAGVNRQPVDIILTDIPYGQHSQWRHAAEHPAQPGSSLLDPMLAALAGLLSETSLVAIASDKAQKVAGAAAAQQALPTDIQRLAHWRLGKRQVTILGRCRGGS